MRGLVNIRTVPNSPNSSQKNKLLNRPLRSVNDNCNQRTADADQIMQMDNDNAGPS